jgi:hypothetical protein
MDLVIQSAELPTDAVEAFRVACVARRVQRRLNSARLLDIQDDAETRKAAVRSLPTGGATRPSSSRG